MIRHPFFTAAAVDVAFASLQLVMSDRIEELQRRHAAAEAGGGEERAPASTPKGSSPARADRPAAR